MQFVQQYYFGTEAMRQSTAGSLDAARMNLIKNTIISVQEGAERIERLFGSDVRRPLAKSVTICGMGSSFLYPSGTFSYKILK